MKYYETPVTNWQHLVDVFNTSVDVCNKLAQTYNTHYRSMPVLKYVVEKCIDATTCAAECNTKDDISVCREAAKNKPYRTVGGLVDHIIKYKPFGITNKKDLSKLVKDSINNTPYFKYESKYFESRNYNVVPKDKLEIVIHNYRYLLPIILEYYKDKPVVDSYSIRQSGLWSSPGISMLWCHDYGGLLPCFSEQSFVFPVTIAHIDNGCDGVTTQFANRFMSAIGHNMCHAFDLICRHACFNNLTWQWVADTIKNPLPLEIVKSSNPYETLSTCAFTAHTEDSGIAVKFDKSYFLK